MRDHLTEARRWLEPVAHLDDIESSDLATRANIAASRLAWKQGDLVKGQRYARRAHELAIESNDPILLGLACENLGIAVGLVDMAEGYALLLESVVHFRRAESRTGLASALNNLGYAQLELDLVEQATSAVDESIDLLREMGNEIGLGYALHTRGYAELFRGAHHGARPFLEEALALAVYLEDVSSIADTIDGLAHCAVADGDARRAAVLWGAGDAMRKRGGWTVQSIERNLRNRIETTVENNLGVKAYTTARDEGRDMSIDDAIKLALIARAPA